MIIGPSIHDNNIGGIFNHMKMLSKLEIFRNAYFFDVGSIHSKAKQPVYKILYNILSLRNEIYKNNISIILINTSIDLTSIIKLSLILLVLPRKIQIHIYYHGGNYENITLLKNKLFRRGINYILRNNAQYYFLYSAQRDSFKKFFNCENTQLYLNYSDYNNIIEHKSNPISKLRLLFCGRIVKSKGVYELLEAFNYLYHHETDDILLRFVGVGPDYDRLKNMAQKYNIKGIEFTGYLSGRDLESVYADSDLTVLPSYREAFPFIMIESFRAGIPMICTPVGALSEYVRDGITGFKIEKRSVNSIIHTIRKCINNGDLIDHMSKNCYDLYKSKLTKNRAEVYYSEVINSH